MTCTYIKIDLVNMNSYIILVKICKLVLKILRGNENLAKIKGHNSGTNLGKMACHNPKLDHININTHTKFG